MNLIDDSFAKLILNVSQFETRFLCEEKVYQKTVMPKL